MERLNHFLEYCRTHRYERQTEVCSGHQRMHELFLRDPASFGLNNLAYHQGETYFVRDGQKLVLGASSVDSGNRLITPDAIAVSNVPHVIELTTGSAKKKREGLIFAGRAISDSFGFSEVMLHFIRMRRDNSIYHASVALRRGEFIPVSGRPWQEREMALA